MVQINYPNRCVKPLVEENYNSEIIYKKTKTNLDQASGRVYCTNEAIFLLYLIIKIYFKLKFKKSQKVNKTPSI